MLLLDGLAGARMLGISAYRRLMPHATGWRLTAKTNGEFSGTIGGGGTFRKPQSAGYEWSVSGLGRIAAGTRIILRKSDEEQAAWDMAFSFEDGETLEVRGRALADDGATAGMFTLPLPPPYRYTEATIGAFKIDVSTKFVSSYPDCRPKR